MVDPRPFEPAMPQVVQDAITRARAGEGPARSWVQASYASQQIDASLEQLRSGDDAVLAGWLAGMTMFTDTRRVIAGVIDRERIYAPISHILDAFAAGIRGSVAPTKRQWSVIERLVARNSAASASFCALLPASVCVDSPITRDHASRIAALIGEPARHTLTIARQSATDRNATRLDAALATVVTPPVDTSAESELLDRLLDAWRATHDPELEPPIARLGRMLAVRRGPLRSRDTQPEYSEIEGLWQRKVRDRIPGDLDVLLDVPGGWHYTLRARIEQLGKLAPDPRMARVLDLVAMLDNATTAGGYPHLIATIAEYLLPRLASPSNASRLDAMARARPEHAAILGTIRSAITASVGTADPALLACARATTQGREVIERLFADVAAEPRDLGARHVLADALQAAADPRGDFIALQLAIADGATDPKLHARAALLLAVHFETWTAALPSLERTDSRFVHGFLSAASTNGDAGSLAYARDRPEWATVEKLDLSARELDLAALVQRMPLVRAITCARRDAFEQLAATGSYPQLRALGTTDEWMPDELHAFPNVRVIGSCWWHGDPIQQFRLAMRRATQLGLDALVWFGPGIQRTSEALQCHDGSIELRFAITRHVRGGFAPTGWLVRLPRSGPARIAWDGDPAAAVNTHDFELAFLLSDIKAAGVSRFEVYLPPTITGGDAILEKLSEHHAIERGEPVDLAG